MSDNQSQVPEIPQALEIADGYLHEAQDVLWNTASELPDDAETQLLEELTEDIWKVQHHLKNLQGEFEK